MSEQKRRSPIVLVGIVTLVAFLAAFITAIAQQAILGKTRVVVTTAVAFAASMFVAWRMK